MVLLFNNKVLCDPPLTQQELVWMRKKHLLIKFADLSTFGVKKKCMNSLLYV